MDEKNPCCCREPDWKDHYSGPIRDGDFGNSVVAKVMKCLNCGIIRLDETSCMKLSDYEGDVYRQSLNQTHDIDAYLNDHADRIDFILGHMPPFTPDDKVFADIGAAGGGYLERFKGVARKCIAIEPNNAFRNSLTQRKYAAYRSIDEAANVHGKQVDIALSCEVIEHVEDPRTFLAEIANLLKPEGELMITTPNANDVLLNLASDIFAPFFYRRQHRWYFTGDTLGKLAMESGFEIKDCYTAQFYGISNTMNWLRHERPMGHERLEGIDDEIDHQWRSWLAKAGMGSSLILKVQKLT